MTVFYFSRCPGDVDDYGNNNEDGKVYAEIVTDYASDNTTDYVSWGFWFKVPKQTGNNKFYDLAAFAIPNTPHGLHNAPTGTATYTGGMLGLHTAQKDGKVQLKRLTGVASIAANFGSASQPGSINATFNGFKLDGQSVTGKITFSETIVLDARNRPAYARSGPRVRGSSTATIDGVSYDRSAFTFGFAGPGTNTATAPTGIVGTLTGGNASSNHAFVASFGAKKAE